MTTPDAGRDARGSALTRAVLRASWPPAAVLLLHVVITMGFDAYRVAPWLDIPMHLIGGMVIARFWRTLLPVALEPRLATPELAATERVLVFALVSLAAVGWEFTELLSDRLLGTELLRSLDDTLADLLWGLIGGIVYLAGDLRRVGGRRLRE